MKLSRFLLTGGALASLASLEKFRLALDHRREIAKRPTAEPRYTTQHSTNGAREMARRVRQGAHQRQLDSHTVKPRHIFGWSCKP